MFAGNTAGLDPFIFHLPWGHSKLALLHPLSVTTPLMFYSCSAWNPLWGSFISLITLSNCLGAPVSPFRSIPGSSPISLLLHHSWMCRSVQLLIWIIKLMRFRSKFKEGSFFCLTQKTRGCLLQGTTARPGNTNFPGAAPAVLACQALPSRDWGVEAGGEQWNLSVSASLHRPLRLRQSSTSTRPQIHPPADALSGFTCSPDVPGLF